MPLLTIPVMGTAVLGVLLAAGSAQAQWTVTVLTPTSGASGALSFASGVGSQAGWTQHPGGVTRAALWHGAAGTWVNLDPVGSGSSGVYGVSGSQQVGFADVGASRASLWSGTAASWIDLSPALSSTSEADAIGDGQQVGWAVIDTIHRAGLWGGTAASWTDLSRAGWISSEARGVNGGVQVGWINDGRSHASLWTGSAASWVDLSPAGTGDSVAWGVQGGHQVGSATVSNINHASLWSGSAATWVDLHPAAGSTGSEAFGNFQGWQVGYAYIGGVRHASLWSGTSASREDLFLALPAGYSSSFAESVWSDGVTVFVTGYGFNSNVPRNDALLWTRASGCAGVSGQPINAAACTSGMTMFSVTTFGTGVSLQWQVDNLGAWVNLADGLSVAIGGSYSGRIQGSTTSQLTVGPMSLIGPPTNSIRVRCVASNSCGSVNSDAASVTINSADFNGDGDTGTDADIEAFFACLAGNCCPTCGSADFNGDGDIGTDADIEAFFRVLAGGSC